MDFERENSKISNILPRYKYDFSVKIQISVLTSFHQNEIVWTQIGLLTQCAILHNLKQQNDFYLLQKFKYFGGKIQFFV